MSGLPISRKAAQAVERASTLDRAWFKQHAERAYRLRPALPHEFPGVHWPDGAARLALVKQVLLGTRLRLAFWATRPVCDCDKCLAGVWEAMAPPQVRDVAMTASVAGLRAGL